MPYFRELPNIQFNNRTKNEVSNDEVIIVKNLFKRAKIREDFAQVATAFEYYSITGDERPDQVAEKFYGDPELDWVVLLTNNILNVQDEWPLNLDSFYKYMIDKYGSEESFDDVHHYETIAIYDSYNREVLPGGLFVDEAFYNAPEFVSIDETPPGITFPTPLSKPTQPRSIAGPIIGTAFTTSLTALKGAATALEMALKKYSGKPVTGLIVPEPPIALSILASSELICATTSSP
jgi:hypothetical protein